jgi:hypothetical protein
MYQTRSGPRDLSTYKEGPEEADGGSSRFGL